MFAWEDEQLGELCLLLQTVILKVDKDDRWLWNLEKSNAFSVRSAYNFQTAQVIVDAPVDVKLLWHKDIPLKVVVFAPFRNRLPTKDNLILRGVITNDSCLCVTGCGSPKTVNRLFLHCSFFGLVWNCLLR